jgi:hypothetical protein
VGGREVKMMNSELRKDGMDGMDKMDEMDK